MLMGASVLWGGCATLISVVVCALLVRFKLPYLSDSHMLADTAAQQALHSKPTPRIGGAAVLLSFAVVLFLNRANIETDLLLAMLAGLVIFVAGLKEDICRNVSPRARLLAAMISAAVAMGLTAEFVPSLLPQLDPVFGFLLLPVLVTLIWSSGTCHAMNLIDGLNGLSSSYAMVASSAIVVIAMQTGDVDVQFTGLVLCAALLGFFLLNWPFAKIFMGDAGAYAIGHALAWLGIVLMARNPQLSPLAMLLVLFWPVADTAFSIMRRWMLKKAINQPDRMHFHHIMIRLLARLTGKRHSDPDLNPLATLALMPFFAAPAVLGVVFWNSPLLALLALVVFTALFMLSYWAAVGVLATRKASKPLLAEKPLAQAGLATADVSALGGMYVKEAVSIDVRILRMTPQGPWQLITQSGARADRKWSRHFRTDEEAWLFFLRTVEVDGVASVLGDPKIVPFKQPEPQLQAS